MLLAAIPACIGGTVMAVLPVIDRTMAKYVTGEQLQAELKKRDEEWSRASRECSDAMAKAGTAEGVARDAKSQCDALNVLYQSMQGRRRER